VEKFLKYGFEITEASDGLEALSYTRNTTFDAVFSDLEMPGLNGFELLTAIKNDPRALDKPVVIVTSRDEPETKAKALELGADAFLAKPVSDAMIEALLDQLAITPEM
ncbi:MAG: response regulator, partial [Planctomycetaceae bacterium]